MKNFIQIIYKEKFGGVKKKLVWKECKQQFKKHNQFHFGTFVLAFYFYYGDNA